MSEMRHTPGPWKVQTDFNGKAKLDRLHGYTVDQDDPKEGRPFVVSTWSLPNAHLIAAAPDLLEALKWFVERRSPIQAKLDLHGPADMAEAMRAAFSDAAAAIAKAEGRQ